MLANITEFGATPLYDNVTLKQAGVAIVLYPLSAFRAMSQAALNVYQCIRQDGNQQRIINTMQTRSELYQHLGYHKYEDKLDALFAQARDEQA